MSEEVRLTVQRPWSVAAVLLSLGTFVLAVVVFITNFPRGLTVLACAVLAVGVGWWGIQRRRAARSIALAVAGLLVLGAVALVVFEGETLQDAIVLVAFFAALYAAREGLKPR